MGFTLFALSGSLLKLDKGRRSYLENQVSVHQMFRNAVTNKSFQYTQNIVPGIDSGSSNFTNGTYEFEIRNNHMDDNANQRFNSFIVPENGYTMRTIDYYLSLNSGNNQRNISIRVPSNTQRSRDTALNKSTIALNIPAINFSNLSDQQLLSGNIASTQTQVGHVADLEIVNNNTLRLTLTDRSEQELTLGNDIDPNTFALTQGWRLVDGVWRLSIGLYDTANSVEGCVIEDFWSSYLSGFSSLNCVDLGLQLTAPIIGRRYPDPTGFPMCEENVSYAQGHVCQEDGILFKANVSNAKGLPLTNNTDWRIYYPSSDWVAPYTQGGVYDIGNLVVYDGIIFRVTKNEETQDPYVGEWGKEDGIYEFDENVEKYPTGSIALYEENFYRKKNNSSKKLITNPQHWENLGSTLEQEEIDNLNSDFKSLVSEGMSVADAQENTKIVFPYREQDPSQELLNCVGSYPPIDTDTYDQCINGENTYQSGDMCYENNMLFVPNWYTQLSPYHNPSAWRVYIPSLNWVVPYSVNVVYESGTKVIFDNKRFETTRRTEKSSDPYGNDKDVWKIDGIYEWDNRIRYLENDIVIRDGNFYRNRQNGQVGYDPLDVNSPWSDEWENLGSTYNNQTTEEVLNSCAAYYQVDGDQNNSGGDVITELVYNLFDSTVGSGDTETRYSPEGTPLANLAGDTATLIASEDLSNGEIRMFLTSDQRQSILDGDTSLSDANNYVELMFADSIAVRTSYGDDTVDALTMSNSAIATFSDSDTINITDSENNLYVLDPAASTLQDEPLASYGNDILNLGSSINDNIQMGGGNDTANITIAQGLDLSATEGNDNINIGTSVGVKNITTGDGDDIV